MCMDDSIYNEFLYNKTRSSLISNCEVERIQALRRTYIIAIKRIYLNLKEAMAILYRSR